MPHRWCRLAQGRHQRQAPARDRPCNGVVVRSAAVQDADVDSIDSDSPMPRLRDLPNLGPASERMLSAAGIETPDQLDQIGAAEAFRRVLLTDSRPTLNLLWALEGALLGIDWRELPEVRKAALLAELEGRT
jgi:DNA transformation protein